jgi:hypothetical protein
MFQTRNCKWCHLLERDRASRSIHECHRASLMHRSRIWGCNDHMIIARTSQHRDSLTSHTRLASRSPSDADCSQFLFAFSLDYGEMVTTRQCSPSNGIPSLRGSGGGMTRAAESCGRVSKPRQDDARRADVCKWQLLPPLRRRSLDGSRESWAQNLVFSSKVEHREDLQSRSSIVSVGHKAQHLNGKAKILYLKECLTRCRSAMPP